MTMFGSYGGAEAGDAVHRHIEIHTIRSVGEAVRVFFAASRKRNKQHRKAFHQIVRLGLEDAVLDGRHTPARFLPQFLPPFFTTWTHDSFSLSHHSTTANHMIKGYIMLKEIFQMKSNKI